MPDLQCRQRRTNYAGGLPTAFSTLTFVTGERHDAGQVRLFFDVLVCPPWCHFLIIMLGVAAREPIGTFRA
jgi:hypothetical protein